MLSTRRLARAVPTAPAAAVAASVRDGFDPNKARRARSAS
jgi:hypothetical protein